MAKVRSEPVQSAGDISDGESSVEGDEVLQQKRVVVQKSLDRCRFCDLELNRYNRMEGAVCTSCSKVVYHRYENLAQFSRFAIMENAGSVYQSLEKAYRVKNFMQGVDELRNLYFEKKIVKPWVDEEQRLKEEAFQKRD